MKCRYVLMTCDEGIDVPIKVFFNGKTAEKEAAFLNKENDRQYYWVECVPINE